MIDYYFDITTVNLLTVIYWFCFVFIICKSVIDYSFDFVVYFVEICDRSLILFCYLYCYRLC